jgi:DNA-binding MarR family transcriptional regulator
VRKPNISKVATELGMHHHSAVELVNRLIKRGLLRKNRDKRDRRHALLQATPRGKRLLRQAILTEYAEMREFAPELLQNLRLFLKQRRVLTNSSGSKS